MLASIQIVYLYGLKFERKERADEIRGLEAKNLWERILGYLALRRGLLMLRKWFLK